MEKKNVREWIQYMCGKFYSCDRYYCYFKEGDNICYIDIDSKYNEFTKKYLYVATIRYIDDDKKVLFINLTEEEYEYINESIKKTKDKQVLEFIDRMSRRFVVWADGYTTRFFYTEEEARAFYESVDKGGDYYIGMEEERDV